VVGRPGVKGVLASYRWRRRLARLAVLAVVAAGVFAVIRIWPDSSSETAPVSNVPLHIRDTTPKAVRLKATDRQRALKVASRFVFTAVARKHVDRAWSLVAPNLREGVTRKQWDQGTMPVPPFPVADARWRLEYSDTAGVGFSLALFPTRQSHVRAQVFLIGLHQIGRGHARHFVVDQWQAAPERQLESVGGDGGGGSGVANIASDVPPNSSSESALWLILPLGFFSLVILIPVGIGTIGWYRDRRARLALGK
jgi:hypothetical protein